MKSVVIIPARYESSRFPGKPLHLIQNKAMINWVVDAAEKSNVTDVFVATDNDKILEHCEASGYNVLMTSPDCANGTERVLEALDLLHLEDDHYDIIINVQGDEPLIKPEMLNSILEELEDEENEICTFIKEIDSDVEFESEHVVKAVCTLFEGDKADILYFSRAPIPTGESRKYQHIGIYGFTSEALEEIRNMPPTNLEKAEKLEQLRWLQNHMVISGILTENTLIGVDVPEDIASVESFLKSV